AGIRRATAPGPPSSRVTGPRAMPRPADSCGPLRGRLRVVNPLAAGDGGTSRDTSPLSCSAGWYQADNPATLATPRRAPPMPTMDVTLDLEKFRVVQKNEESADEPYLWTIFIKADGSTISLANPASSKAAYRAPPGSHGDLGPGSDNMETNDLVSVPSSIGHWQTKLRTVDGAPSPLPENLSIVAAVVVGLEEDATSDSAAEAGRVALVEAIRTEVDKAIRAGVTPNVEEITDKAKNAVRDAIKSASMSVFSFMPI